jgi:hypothetical protein
MQFRFRLTGLSFLAVVIFVYSAGAAQDPAGTPTAAQARAAKTELRRGDQGATGSPVMVDGDWQVSWTGRLGVEKCVLHLAQQGSALTGTFKDQRGISQLTGSVDDKKISFEVEFTGAHPFAIRFTGTVNNDKMDGLTEAVGMQAYLGHPGEVVRPEHPWTASRRIEPSTQAKESAAKSATAPKN